MKELIYPFDPDMIMQKRKSLRRRLLEGSDDHIRKKIAILGGYTTSDIKLIMELFLLNNGIKPEFYESEYNRFYQDAVFPNLELDEFAPDIIYICTSNHNITAYPRMADSPEDVDRLVSDEMNRFTSVWESLKNKYHCPVIQNNFEMPYYRLLGNMDVTDFHGRVNFLTRLNVLFSEYASQHEGLYICDINYISADCGLSKWSDPFYYHMYKYALCPSAIPYLAENVSNIIKSVFGKNKKGMVLDLDNTLWGGVVGDDGPEGIAIGPEVSEGQAYSEFQSYIKEHKQIGVILNVNSKNDMENAVAGLSHPDGVLRPDDFIAIKANWEPKDRNFREIASELDLLPESLVFIDDNPAERHIVEQIEGVCAPDIGSIRDYIRVIDRNGFFEVTSLSEDDIKRNDMYKENYQRAKLSETFTDYNEYLLSLEMKGEIKAFAPMYISRIAQLTNKSNQFNLTTVRYTAEQIKAAAEDTGRITLYGKLSDKFGDNGVVSVVIGRQEKNECHIELWLMSCRVLKRNMEEAMLDTLVKRCQERDISKLIGYYYPTKKNGMVRDFYERMGFEKLSSDETGNTVWELDISGSYENKNKVIDVEE
ncbi:MAG: HAD-IIIC family phosphatase [Oscillospiraceae bacterium]|nr:HAD-IIIC family phosphatase [Oscillospiraceae bacterium]